MDEMTIKTSWTKALIAKIIRKIIKDKLGIEAILDLGDISVGIGEKTADVHISLDAKIDKNELGKLLNGLM